MDIKDNPRIQKQIGFSINFRKLFAILFRHKWLYFKALPLAFVVAVIYSLSLPNYYKCTVKLVPELGSGAKTGGSLAGLASSFGVNLGADQSGADAINPTLYPDLMESVDFKTSLFPIKVVRKEDGKSFSYYDYLENEQKLPWWKSAVKSIFGEKKETSKDINPFELTLDQTLIIKKIDKMVSCTVDKKTKVITINVTDQDPLICATLADSVKTRLQNFITDYRTSKSRVDLDYNKKMLVEAKEKYESARQRYASFADSHRDVTSLSGQTKQAELMNELQLRQSIYQQVAGQLQKAEMKVQEETPAFTTLQSATVPVVKAGPKRAQMCLAFVFLAFILTTVWVLYKDEDSKYILV